MPAKQGLIITVSARNISIWSQEPERLQEDLPAKQGLIIAVSARNISIWSQEPHLASKTPETEKRNCLVSSLVHVLMGFGRRIPFKIKEALKKNSRSPVRSASYREAPHLDNFQCFKSEFAAS